MTIIKGKRLWKALNVFAIFSVLYFKKLRCSDLIFDRLKIGCFYETRLKSEVRVEKKSKSKKWGTSHIERRWDCCQWHNLTRDTNWDCVRLYRMERKRFVRKHWVRTKFLSYLALHSLSWNKKTHRIFGRIRPFGSSYHGIMESFTRAQF
jgi:hypothetical protein